MKRMPIVALVGRMNVGKSTLFNRLSSDIKSITLDYAGVTRDVIRDTVTWADRSFELVDTGGLQFKRLKDPLQQKVQEKALAAVAEADVIVFVVDGTVGVLAEDRDIMRELNALRKPVIVAVNKSDVRGTEEAHFEFKSLGGVELITLSAEHGRGIGEFLEMVLKHLPERGSRDVKEARYRVMLLGRPNVGKSSLMNQLVHYERSITFDQPGTTREAISAPVIFNKEHIILTDTPGLRRKSSVSGELEGEMVHSALQALTETDIVLLVIDGSQGGLVDQELKLGFYAFTERYKALIIVVNKYDLMTEEHKLALEDSFSQYKHLIDKVPVLKTSCLTGWHVGKLLPIINEVWERHSMQLPQQELQHLFISELERKPLMRNEQRLTVHKVKQVATAPITIGLAVNEPVWFSTAQLGFFENLLRKKYRLIGAPVKFVVRKKLT